MRFKMNRRNLLRNGLLSSAALFTLPALAADVCKPGRTPAQTEGPFYPVAEQVDTDADLVVVQGKSQIADGEIVLVEGLLTDQQCLPVSGALVEIWQACRSGRYNHPSDPNTAPLDPNFQYWGKATTDKNGFYRFRTIIPGAYPADTNWMRPPHIHFKVSRLGYNELITQMYFDGNSFNKSDKILRQLKKIDQEKVIVQFHESPSAPHPVGTFNIQIVKV
jgi:protocatechuate 3,4-dioxygenase beta subunit